MVKLIEDYIVEISKEQKTKILKAARLAPTGDNAQHWDISFSSNKLIIRHLKRLANHILNDEYSASLLSLGTVIESINIAASEFGFVAHLEYSLDDLGAEVWASIFFSADESIIPDKLINQLEKRETNRSSYKKQRIPLDLLTEVNSFGEKLGIKISERSRPSERCKKYLVRCEQYVWNNRTVFKDTVKWIRFTDKEVKETRDGFSLDNLLLKKLDGFMIKAFIKSELFFKLMWSIGVKFKAHFDSKKSIGNTGSFITFSAENPKEVDVVNCGRVMFRTWVTLNGIGNGVQPLTIACLLPYNLGKFGKLRNCPQNYLEEFKSSRMYFEESFDLNHEEQVIWMLRTGPCAPLNEKQRTLRKNLKD